MNALTNIVLRLFFAIRLTIELQVIRMVMRSKLDRLIVQERKRLVRDVTVADEDLEDALLRFAQRTARRLRLENRLAMYRVQRKFEESVAALVW